MDVRGSALVSLVEAAYDQTIPDEEWLPNLMRVGRPVLDYGSGVTGMIGTRPAEPGPPNVEQVHVDGMSSGFPVRVMQAVAELPVEKIHRQTESGILMLSELSAEDDRMRQAWKRHVGEGLDAIGITALDPDGLGIHFMAPIEKPTSLTGFVRARWQMLTAHLCAGLRLRRGRLVSSGPLPNGADAVIDPKTFRVTDRRSSEIGSDRVGALRDAAQRVDEARGRKRHEDPDDSLAMWWALVRGRWSIVDWFDTDGRRYVLALPNPPRAPDPRGLTERESQVVAHAVLGESHKMIAYRLGVSRSRVSAALKSARRKLGVKTHAELVRRLDGWPSVQSKP